ncbi:MAG: DUF2330 domain-containing protein [Pseudomonadota bacterium]
MSVTRITFCTWLLAASFSSFGFCGFYVAGDDTKLYNESSRVVMVRDGERTVMTMSNDFRGDASQFAVVIPIPEVLERGQINVGDGALIEQLDAFSAPRLVEYFDQDPCQHLRRYKRLLEAPAAAMDIMADESAAERKALGVTVAARHQVGEYDIVILDATQSEGLITWLTSQGYSLPPGARQVLGSYIRQGLKFFAAKVNLQRQQHLGYALLRPLQIAYESKRFMLPIRLGMLNASGEQELLVYAISKTGRVETSNYRSVFMATNNELPNYVREDFGNFYQAAFDKHLDAHGRQVAITEYAWDMASCDPCAGQPLSPAQLKALGVFWLTDNHTRSNPTFLTRLHLRYDQTRFPEDLMFTETGDRKNFQSRYVVRNPWLGESQCAEAHRYREYELPQRREQQSQVLANLTGWDIQTIRQRSGLNDTPQKAPWWEQLWLGMGG